MHKKPPADKQEAIFGIAKNDTEHAIGDRIKHAEYGEGTILQIAGDVLVVAFSGKGVKKIVASVAPIEKI
jgi:DNA helicase-2/ATP-dependent DNA helicase PcrA